MAKSKASKQREAARVARQLGTRSMPGKPVKAAKPPADQNLGSLMALLSGLSASTSGGNPRDGMSKPYLVRDYNTWSVRIIIPPAVRHLFPDADGKPQKVIKRSTGVTDIILAREVSKPMIAEIKAQIAQAKATMRPPIEERAEALVMQFLADRKLVKDRPVLRDLAEFILRQKGV